MAIKRRQRWVWTNVPDVNWKRVPDGRSSNCERTVSEACPCPPHHEVAACWWSKTVVTVATANISQISSGCAAKDIKLVNAGMCVCCADENTLIGIIIGLVLFSVISTTLGIIITACICRSRYRPILSIFILVITINVNSSFILRHSRTDLTKVLVIQQYAHRWTEILSGVCK